MDIFTKKVISAVCVGALISSPMIHADHEKIMSPFAAVINAVTQGGRIPIVINHHTTQHIVQNRPTSENSSTLSKISSLVGNAAFKGCSLAYKLASTQAGLYCTSALLMGGLVYYNRKVITQTVHTAHEKTRELFNQKMSELKNNLDTLTEKISKIKEHITQENSNLKTWLRPLFVSNKEQLKKLEKQLQELTSQKEQLEKTLLELFNENQKLRTENKEFHETSHSEIQKLKAGQEAQQKQLELLTKTIDHLSKQIEGLKNIIGTPTDKQTTLFSILKYLPTFGLNN